MKIYSIKNIEKCWDKEGIYFLYSDDELIYIGRSNNIKRRILQHVKCKYPLFQMVESKDIKRFSWIDIDEHENCKYIETFLRNNIPTKYNFNLKCYEYNESPLSKEDIDKAREDISDI